MRLALIMWWFVGRNRDVATFYLDFDAAVLATGSAIAVNRTPASRSDEFGQVCQDAWLQDWNVATAACED